MDGYAHIPRLRISALRAIQVLLTTALMLAASLVYAAVGVTELPGREGDGPVTVFYSSSSAAGSVRRGPFSFELATDGSPQRGNGRLIIISHGSGGTAWGHADLARVLVEDGFVVALPQHRGDHYRDPSEPGPESWKRRPHEVSRAIDAIAQDARFAELLDLGKVGMYGMSAGGLTALALAGGRWSPSEMKRHCNAHIDEDFHSCVGLATRLRGNLLDGLKKAVALQVIGSRFDDAKWYGHTDPRIAAVIAGVPYAAVFDMDSLAAPQVPLGLVAAGQDKWLVPRFHSDRVRAVCGSCELVAELPDAGHGALLSPFPPNLSGLLAELLSDGPGFDRAALPEVDRRISRFFQRHLLGGEWRR